MTDRSSQPAGAPAPEGGLPRIIQGGMGIAAGGNINPEGVSMFEPIGGSAPKYTGQNVINPLAGICAAGMLLVISRKSRPLVTRLPLASEWTSKRPCCSRWPSRCARRC